MSVSQSVKLNVEYQAAMSGVNFLLCHDVADGISGGNVCVSPEDLMETKTTHTWTVYHSVLTQCINTVY